MGDIMQKPEVNIQELLEKAGNVEMLEKLLNMRRELKAEFAKDQFFAALSRMQAECPIIEKTKKVIIGNEVRYRYASIDAIVKQTKSVIEKHGFSYVLKPRQTESEFIAVCEVHHIDGHTETTEFAVPIDAGARMNAAQKIAAASTYAKRYAFCNAFGIMTSDDDTDAQGGFEEPLNVSEPEKRKKTSPRQSSSVSEEISDEAKAILTDYWGQLTLLVSYECINSDEKMQMWEDAKKKHQDIEYVQQLVRTTAEEIASKGITIQETF